MPDARSVASHNADRLSAAARAFTAQAMMAAAIKADGPAGPPGSRIARHAREATAMAALLL